MTGRDGELHGRGTAVWVVISLALILAAQSSLAETRPNFLVVLVDDAGFMDFGAYGGEARTPHIDRLAAEGVRFSNYHTSPLCAPSRAMLLTGLDNHRTGVATIPEVLTEEQKDSPAYALHLQPGVRTVADVLRADGYETFMTGKWHLGRGQGQLPDAHGFDRSFVLDASGADNWEQKSFLPFYDEAPWFEDGEPADLPEDFYSSRFLVDQLMTYLESRDPASPFFAYLAFQAIHVPVQAPREFTDRYEGVYSDGWDVVRERRFERARELDLVPPTAAAPRLHPSLRSWESLTPEEQVHYERSMMVNAGMLEAMDHHLGRLIAFLERTGALENTVIIVTSDNGPEFGDPTVDARFRFWMSQNGYHADPDRAGERGYMGAIGPEWASAAAVPGSLFKMYASEGGTRVPLIVRIPGVTAPEFNHALTFVTDVAPTILDIVGSEARVDMDGRSLMPLLEAETDRIYGENEAVGLEVAGNAALFKGRFKLTRNTLPHGDAQWRLHDLLEDPAELNDLSAERPALREQLFADYQRFATDVGVVALPADFDITAQVASNTLDKLVSRNTGRLIGFGLALIALIAAVAVFVRRRRAGHGQGPV